MLFVLSVTLKAYYTIGFVACFYLKVLFCPEVLSSEKVHSKSLMQLFFKLEQRLLRSVQLPSLLLQGSQEGQCTSTNAAVQARTAELHVCLELASSRG